LLFRPSFIAGDRRFRVANGLSKATGGVGYDMWSG
jgi:hypothetical protein